MADKETKHTPPAAAPAAAGGEGGKSKRKEKKDKKKKVKVAKAVVPHSKPLDPPPPYLQHRIDLFDKLWAEQEAELAAKPTEKIKVTLLPSGKEIEADSWRTSPQSIAEVENPKGHHATVIAKVDGNTWDLTRVLEASCTLQFLGWDDDDAKSTFWHSTAHMLGQALEICTGGTLCYGPPIADGFFYDISLSNVADNTISTEAFSGIEAVMKKATNEKQPFQRLVVSKENLLEMFKFNEFKQRILNERVTTPSTTVYRNGPLIDLCRGPHVLHTGKIKAVKCTKTSSTYWEGNAEADVLTRVYGISFPDKKLLKEWVEIQKQAAERDHRKIGREQNLFFFHDLSPGSCFFLPKGAFIYNTLVDFIKSEYRKRGFKEVVTPNIFNSALWETSGHWQHYKDHMFSFEAEKSTFALKPMNCPGHCLMFGHNTHSYRELPLRLADFGVLHRNELAGALTGLVRVRRFQQDDAHIFCRHDQIEQEIAGCLDFLQFVYSKFGFTFELNLSTRPEKYIGEIEVWDKAEASLKKCLKEFVGDGWKLNPGDGAFYGPKIDITIKDALRRAHQCATIQLDFQLPERFELSYTPAQHSDTPPRPVMIHRAILGSVERCIAILTESCGGKWPFWLSPAQIRLIPARPESSAYASKMAKVFQEAGFEVSEDTGLHTQFKKKVAMAQVQQCNFMLVVGPGEEGRGTVNVRVRSGGTLGEYTPQEVIDHCNKLVALKHVNDDELVMPPPAASKAKAEAPAAAAAEAPPAAPAPATAAAGLNLPDTAKSAEV